MNIPVILSGKAAIPSLIAIRRKVDKATKRALEVYELAQKDLRRIANDNRPVTDCRHVLGMCPHGPMFPSYFILRGDQSACFPDSIGPNTRTLARPRPVAVSARSAQLVALHGSDAVQDPDEGPDDEWPFFETSPLSMEEALQC